MIFQFFYTALRTININVDYSIISLRLSTTDTFSIFYSILVDCALDFISIRFQFVFIVLSHVQDWELVTKLAKKNFHTVFPVLE